MSRIGKQPIDIPNGVEIKVEGSIIEFKKGNATKELDTKNNVLVKVENNQLVFLPKGESRQERAFWGTYRSLANNIVIGLTSGFERKLAINGVGYRASVSGDILELQLGFSHPIKYKVPQGVSVAVDKNIIIISGSDKQVVGQTAAKIRAYRPPEPYKGKGVKYVEENIIRKAGKTSKK